jgi:large subunit ribosomal protein L21
MPTYAIIHTGGKQYQVSPGDLLDVEKLPQEVGATVTLEDVRLISGQDGLVMGTPQVSGAAVVAEVRDQLRGPKIVVFKYKAKTRYHKKNGHRQSYTRLLINQILLDGEVKADSEQARLRRPLRPRTEIGAASSQEAQGASPPADALQQQNETPQENVSPSDVPMEEKQTDGA